MIIAEQFVKGKHDEASCEDGIVATAHFVVAKYYRISMEFPSCLAV